MADAKLTFVERPDLPETFVDHCERVLFDGQTLRVDLAVTRLDADSKEGQVRGKRVMACRLAMTPNAALQLHNSLTRLVSAMEAKGLVHRKGNAPGSPKAQ